MSPKKGRPVSENARREKVEIRMSPDELTKLAYCCKITGKTKSEVIREGIDNIYTKLNNLK